MMSDVETPIGAAPAAKEAPPQSAPPRSARPGAAPIDAAACAWYATIAILLTLNARVLRQPVVEIGFFAAMTALTAVLGAACGRAPEGVARAARIAFYYLAIPLTFEMVGRVVPYVSPDSRESWLLRADKLLFGSDPTRWIGWQEHAPALTELLQWVYSSFYFLPALLAIRLTFLRKFAAIDHVLLVVVLGFLISYLGYFLVPARSPYRLFHYPFELRGLWATPKLREWLTILEDRRYDVFPSGHSDVTFLVAACAWKYDRKSFFAFFGPVAILLPLGTVYLRYHYAVDVVAGAFFAVLTWRLCASLRKAAPATQELASQELDLTDRDAASLSSR